jgi:hypothetical protein
MVISVELVTAVLSFFITLMILSYVVGDNPLFRIATHLFIGVSAGYIAAIAWWQVLLPKLVVPLRSGSLVDRALALIALLGAGLILLKILPRLSKLGSPAMAYLVGVGAAVAIGGGLTGTLFPQMAAAINSFDLTSVISSNVLDYFGLVGNSLVILLGTITSLAYFHFGARARPDGSVRRFGFIELFAWVGQIFIAITLGVIFAGVYAAALTAFIERMSSLLRFIGLN